MRATLHLHGISLWEAVHWCRQNAIPIVRCYRSRYRRSGKVYYGSYGSGSRSILREGLHHRDVCNSVFFYVLVRPCDFELVKLRFGRLDEDWKNG